MVINRLLGAIEHAGSRTLIEERRGSTLQSVTGVTLSCAVNRARRFLAATGAKPGDRCALLAGNSIHWIAMDLAIMAEGLIAVPLYPRQAAAELVEMIRDCTPGSVYVGDERLRDVLTEAWPGGLRCHLLEEVFDGGQDPVDRPAEATVGEQDVVAIIYTSGTSGVAKGVTLTAANVGHMLGCTLDRVNDLMTGAPSDRQDRVYHYLPLCFAGSWIMMLTCLLRGARLTLNIELSTVASEITEAQADYVLNVPVLLERMRGAVDVAMGLKPRPVRAIYAAATRAWFARHGNPGRLPALRDRVALTLARRLVFSAIRAKLVGPQAPRAMICGSAALDADTQLFFMMLGIPVLQVFGLTETTAICTMDDPKRVEPGRVGRAIGGTEMRVGENEEILVRGPQVFAGYWNRPDETAAVLRDGWFHTGDTGGVDPSGNWRISGRLKNLIVLSSGHNVAPEPIEAMVIRQLPDAQHVVVLGDGRDSLTAIITGPVTREGVEVVLDRLNADLPHYKRIRGFHVRSDPFTIENGFLTANGKLRRGVIEQQVRAEIGYLQGRGQVAETSVAR